MIAFFFIIWGILHDGSNDAHWVTAGVGSSILLAAAVILREVIMRNARKRVVYARKKLDRNVSGLKSRHEEPAEKLTIEKNASIIKTIRQKSDAAKVLGKFADGHKEVFQLCEEYMKVASSQLPTAREGSPRITALRRGRELAGRLHRSHVLRWAELEARVLSQEAQNSADTSEKLKLAKKALDVVEYARKFYPNERNLAESETALRDFAATIKVSDYVARAERAVFKGDRKNAVDLFQEALFFLELEHPESNDARMAAEMIRGEIDKIKLVDEGAVD